MSADKDARIVELERDFSQAEQSRITNAKLLDEALRRLAEQQAWLHTKGFLWQFHHQKAESTELNNLLAKAKEEGRKDAVNTLRSTARTPRELMMLDDLIHKCVPQHQSIK